MRLQIPRIWSTAGTRLFGLELFAESIAAVVYFVFVDTITYY